MKIKKENKEYEEITFNPKINKYNKNLISIKFNHKNNKINNNNNNEKNNKINNDNFINKKKQKKLNKTDLNNILFRLYNLDIKKRKINQNNLIKLYTPTFEPIINKNNNFNNNNNKKIFN